MKRLVLWMLLIASPAIAAGPSAVGSNAAGILVRTTFAGLSTPSDGSVRMCSNCNEGTFPCTGGGTGSFALRIGAAWACPTFSAAAGISQAAADARYLKLDGTQISPTITTPTIASFVNATHAHTTAAGGGLLDAAAIGSGAIAAARGGTNSDSSAATGVPRVTAGAWTYDAGISHLAGLGTGVATFLATPSSANLSSALTTKTGTGLAVFGTNPVFGTGTSRYLTDFYGTGPQIHLATTDLDSGGYIVSPSIGGIIISGGASTPDFATITAKNSTAAFVRIASGGVLIYSDTGLTPGNTYTPTQRWSVASNGDITVSNSNSRGTCTLNGAATSTCTHTVPSGCIAICTYQSSSVAHIVGCSVSGTTLTAVSGTTLDGGVVSYSCE